MSQTLYLQNWLSINGQSLTIASAWLLSFNRKHKQTVQHIRQIFGCDSWCSVHGNYSYISSIDTCQFYMEFSVTVEPAIVEEHTHHPPVWKVVLSLSGSRGEIQISCKRENFICRYLKETLTEYLAISKTCSKLRILQQINITHKTHVHTININSLLLVLWAPFLVSTIS